MAKKMKKRGRRWLRRWTRPVRNAISLAGLRAVLVLCRLISHRAALALARALGSLAWRLSVQEKAKTLANLELALGKQATPAERAAIGRQAFQSAGMMALETIHSLKWSPEYFRAAVRVNGVENWKTASAPGRGVVFVTAHLGNWELIPPSFFYFSGVAAGVMMRTSRNPLANAMILRTRASHGNPVFTEASPPMAYFKMLRKGGVLGLLADQDTKRLKGTFIDFFGRPAMTPVGPAFLARKAGAAFLPGFVVRDGADPARHELRLLPPLFPDPALDEETDIQRMLQYYSSALEQEVRAHPGQWVWMHERWKRQPPPKPSVAAMP